MHETLMLHVLFNLVEGIYFARYVSSFVARQNLNIFVFEDLATIFQKSFFTEKTSINFSKTKIMI